MQEKLENISLCTYLQDLNNHVCRPIWGLLVYQQKYNYSYIAYHFYGHFLNSFQLTSLLFLFLQYTVRAPL